MIITGPNLSILITAVNTAWLTAYSEAPSDELMKFASDIPSGTGSEVYPFVAEIPQLREWLGSRQAQDIATYDYTLANKDFELTLKLDRNKVLDDQYGVWMQTVVPMIARNAKRKPALLVRDALQAGSSSLCYDGQNFFSTSHPVNKFPGGGFSGVTQRNLWTSKALTFDNYRDVRASMMSYRGESGERLGVMPNLLIVPPALEAQARLILNADMIAGNTIGGITNVGGYSNPFKGSADLVVAPDLAGEDGTWYLADTSKPIKPIIYQRRQEPIVVAQFNPNDDSVFSRKEFTWGVDMRGAAGYALWYLMAKASA